VTSQGAAAAGPGSNLPDAADEPSSFDTSIAHPARVYDYLLGGKDNYEADRVAAEAAIAGSPTVLPGVRANRAFLRRAVEYLAGEAGIRQFLDIGTGLPTADNTHEVAQSVAPDARVVYVDNDPIVLAHARALLNTTSEGATAYVQADAQDTARILDAASRTLDLSKPVAVMILFVMHYIPDSAGPQQIVTRLMDAMPPGSYLTVSATTSDIDADRAAESVRRFNAQPVAARMNLRTREQIAAYFDGLDFIEPGLVPLPQWRAEGSTGPVISAYAGMGRKP
jgi:S-adenosyl methyltransferase